MLKPLDRNKWLTYIKLYEEFNKVGLFEITEIDENQHFYLIKCRLTS